MEIARKSEKQKIVIANNIMAMLKKSDRIF
jgi:hypothetical protein